MAVKISIVGCGPGSPDYLAPATIRAVEQADVLVGTQRLLELFPSSTAERIALRADIEEAIDTIAKRRKTQRVAIIVTGDPGIFSLAKKVLKRFGRDACEIIPGVSSVQLAFARVGVNWDDARIISAHKENPDPELWNAIRDEDKIAILVGRPAAVQWIANAVQGLGDDRCIYVCEDLSLETERVRQVRADNLATLDVRSRAVVLILKGSVLE